MELNVYGLSCFVVTRLILDSLLRNAPLVSVLDSRIDVSVFDDVLGGMVDDEVDDDMGDAVETDVDAVEVADVIDDFAEDVGKVKDIMSPFIKGTEAVELFNVGETGFVLAVNPLNAFAEVLLLDELVGSGDDIVVEMCNKLEEALGDLVDTEVLREGGSVVLEMVDRCLLPFESSDDCVREKWSKLYTECKNDSLLL